jgi:hypothetical protein
LVKGNGAEYVRLTGLILFLDPAPPRAPINPISQMQSEDLKKENYCQIA